MDIFPNESEVEEAAHDLRTICDIDNGRTALVGAVAPVVLALGWGVSQGMAGQYDVIADTLSILTVAVAGPTAVCMVQDCAEDGQSRQRMLMRARHKKVQNDIEHWASAALRRHQVVCYSRIVGKFAAAALFIQMGGIALERTFDLLRQPAAQHTSYTAD